MMRVLEFVVALIIVAVLAVVAGIAMPGSGHVERSLVISKDMRQVYDVLDNFRRFPDYAELTSSDPTIKYDFSGEA
jgi:type II secretory pathway pseudopilin PulG